MFLKNIAIITFITELLPLVVAFIFFKKIKANYLKVFFVYLILLAFFASFSLYLLYFIKSKTAYLFVLRCYIAIEYSIFTYFFYLLIIPKFLKNLLIFSVTLFLGFCIFDYFESNSAVFNNYPALVEFSIFILIIIYYFFQKMNVVSGVPLLSTISFWFCVGLFIYFTGNLSFLIFIRYTKDHALINQMQLIYSCVTIAKNIILAAAWFAHEKLQTDADIIQLPENMKLDDDFTFTNTTNP